jgi:PAS domain S-box-containing protein
MKTQRRANILAVDDVPANLIALEAVLSSEYNLILANSGAEALQILNNRHDIDVILMDLQMPEMDGFEAAARIKKIQNYHDVPIVFITAVYKEDPFIKKGYEAGAIDYFTKPFDPDILRMKLSVYSHFRTKAALLKEREHHVRASEELLTAGRKLSSLIENLPVGVLIADTEGRICQINEEVSRIYKASEPIKHDLYGQMLGWWDETGKVATYENIPLMRALQEGVSSHNELIAIRCLDNTPKKILASASPLRGLDHEIVGAVVVIQDVTESKKIEEELELRITRLVSLGVELEQHVSHH